MALCIVTEKEQEEIEYQHSLLCALAFPRSRQNSREYVREQGGRMLKMSAGELFSEKNRCFIQQPIPYGPKARLAFMHICGEALRSNDPAVELERSARAFMSRLGISDAGSEYDMMRRQMNAIAAMRLLIGYTKDGRSCTIDTKPIFLFETWEPQKYGGFWPSTIQLSLDFFNDLRKHAVPLSVNALRGLSGSALALDWYSFFAYRLHSLERPLFLKWGLLHAQLGHEYANPKDFKRKSLPAIKAVLEVYPSAKVEQVMGGLMLKPSPSPIARKAVGVLPNRADKVKADLMSSAAAISSPRNLNTRTIERFQRLYPRFDCYTCEFDFRFWLDTQATEQPRNYDAAFLGFAKSWVNQKNNTYKR